MKIKPMLARLQSAIGRQDLIEQMVLLPESVSPNCKQNESTKAIDLVVGYNRSPSSQTALDLTLWIAHQTRLATHKRVTVHIVHVVDENQSIPSSARVSVQSSTVSKLSSVVPSINRSRQEAIAVQPRMTVVDPCYFSAIFYQSNRLEQADQILWQARCLAHEWGGVFNAHLRFGDVATELRKVVESEAAELLFLGCSSSHHPIVQQLGSNFPCPVLGIPHNLTAKQVAEKPGK